MNEPISTLARRIQTELNRHDVYDGTDALIRALPQAYQNAIAFVSCDEFRVMIMNQARAEI